MFANDPSLYGLTYRDFPVRPPFLGTPTLPFENVPRIPQAFGYNMPTYYGMNPWETMPRFVPPQFGVTQPFFPTMQLPYHPFLPMNLNAPFYGYYRPFGV